MVALKRLAAGQWRISSKMWKLRMGKEFVGIAGKMVVDLGGEELLERIDQYIVDGAFLCRASLCKWDGWRAGRRSQDSKVDPIRVGIHFPEASSRPAPTFFVRRLKAERARSLFERAWAAGPRLEILVGEVETQAGLCEIG
jgi:hypothetical protein